MRLVQPNWPRFLPSTLVLGIATLGQLGRRLPAPGTWGSLAGLLYFAVFFVDRLSLLPAILLGVLGLYVAVGFCGEAEFRMGRKDPGEVNLDEFVAMPLCFIGWPALLGVAPRWAVFLAPQAKSSRPPSSESWIPAVHFLNLYAPWRRERFVQPGLAFG